MARHAQLVSLWPAGARLCRSCLSAQTGKQAASQRRWLSSKNDTSKYLSKVKNAEEQWQAKAQRIASGEEYNLWDVFEERGFVKDLAGRKEDIRELMRQKRIGAYVGVDPTAPSLHVGHLVPMMPLFWMYFHGYHAVSLLGGATSKIGDPSGRLKDRERMAGSTAATNTAKIHYQLKKIWANVETKSQKYGYKKRWAWKRSLVNNATWWNSLPLLEVLRRLGAGIRMGPMLSRDNVKRKLTEGDGMSFAEFTYPLMQAWDWWHLFSTHNVHMQIGGSDQYGNIVTGIESVKTIRESEPNLEKKMEEGPLHDPVGFTVPLMTDSSGAKFGKSAGNAIWLDPYETSYFDLYGYFVRRPDADVENLLKLFTFLPLPDIAKIMEEQAADPSKRVAQHKLAQEVVSLVHGDEACRLAEEQHRAMYTKGQTMMPMAQATEDDLAAQDPASSGKPVTLNNAPRVDIQLPESLILGKSIARILHAAGLASSVSEGNRLATQRAAYVGGSPGQPANVNKGMTPGLVEFTPVSVWFPEDTKNFLIEGKYLMLRKGKHNLRIIEMVSDEDWKASGKTYPGEPGKGKVRMLSQKLRALKEELKQDGLAAKAKDNISVQDNADAIEEQDEPVLIFPDESPAQVRNLKNKISDLENARKQQQAGAKQD